MRDVVATVQKDQHNGGLPRVSVGGSNNSSTTESSGRNGGATDGSPEINAATTHTDNTVNSLTKQAEVLLDMLLRFEGSLAKCEDESEDFSKARELLQVPLCRLTKIMVPSVQRKIDEIVVAQEMGLEVCESERGADMKDKEGNCFELKVSICKKKGNYKSNFMWPIPTGENIEDIRAKLLEQVAAKTKGALGGAIFRATDRRGAQLNEYIIRGRLLYSFFKHLPLKGKEKYNFGSERCNTCHSYHRLNMFKEWDERGELVTNSSCLLYASVKSQCQ